MRSIHSMQNEEIDKTTERSITNKELLTVPMLAQDPMCPFSEKAIRFYIWRSGVNGLAPAIIRIGKKVLIKRSEWLKWIEAHSQQKRKKASGAR